MRSIPEWMREEYDVYMRSPQWKQRRAQALERAQYRCCMCGFSKWSKQLEVHHVTYERLGNELPDDLVVLCSECHKVADEARAELGKKKSRRALHDARLDAWASKVYGEYWQDAHDPEEVEEHFYEWLERKGE